MSRLGFFSAGVLTATAIFLSGSFLAPGAPGVAKDAPPATILMAPAALLHEQAPHNLPIVEGDLS